MGGNYGFLAFLNNADVPWIDVPKPDIAAKRKAAAKRLAGLEAKLADGIPPERDAAWTGCARITRLSRPNSKSSGMKSPSCGAGCQNTRPLS